MKMSNWGFYIKKVLSLFSAYLNCFMSFVFFFLRLRVRLTEKVLWLISQIRSYSIYHLPTRLFSVSLSFSLISRLLQFIGEHKTKLCSERNFVTTITLFPSNSLSQMYNYSITIHAQDPRDMLLNGCKFIYLQKHLVEHQQTLIPEIKALFIEERKVQRRDKE